MTLKPNTTEPRSCEACGCKEVARLRAHAITWSNLADNLEAERNLFRDKAEYNSIAAKTFADEAKKLADENARLRAFIERAAEHSKCPATVLVARQVLYGHDVREERPTTVFEMIDPEAARKIIEEG
jgi:hypothetical protein